MHHFVQRWRDKSAQADNIHVVFFGCRQNLVTGHHHAQIDNLIVIALQHHTNNVLANVVHIALYRSHQDFPFGLLVFGFFRLDKRNQVGHRLLHYAGAFNDLGQKHLAVAKQVADHVHAVHQWTFNDMNRAFGLLPALFSIFNNKVGNALDQRMFKPFFYRPLAPREILFLGFPAFAFIALGDFQQAIRGIIPAVEHYVFNQPLQFRLDLIVNHQLARVYNTHVHAGLDSVIEKHGVNGFTHRIVTAKGERHVAHTAGNRRMGQVLPNPA